MNRPAWMSDSGATSGAIRNALPGVIRRSSKLIATLHLRRTLWHAACISLCGGCLYVDGPWMLTPNRPPELLDRDPASREVFIQNSTNLVKLEYVDPDQDALNFAWYLNDEPYADKQEGELPSDEYGLIVFSRVLIYADEVEEGDILRCEVSEVAFPERPPSVTGWDLVLPRPPSDEGAP